MGMMEGLSQVFDCGNKTYWQWQATLNTSIMDLPALTELDEFNSDQWLSGDLDLFAFPAAKYEFPIASY